MANMSDLNWDEVCDDDIRVEKYSEESAVFIRTGDYGDQGIILTIQQINEINEELEESFSRALRNRA